MPRDRTDARPRADTEETRRAILQAAHNLFMELGYRAVTTRMVAEASGVKQPLLYYHFADKETLYLEVHREQTAIARAALERIAARKGESIPERLYHVVHYLRQANRQNMGIFFHELRHEMSPQMRATLRELFLTSFVAPITSIFEDGIRTGFLRAPDRGGIEPRLATYMLLSTVSSLSASTEMAAELQVNHGTCLYKQDPVRAIIHVLLYGMATQPFTMPPCSQ